MVSVNIDGALGNGARVLVILHPGRVTRYALESLVRSARRLGVLGATVQAGEVWKRVAAAGSRHVAERAKVAAEIAEIVRREKITHALGYVSNLAFDCGLFPDPSSASGGVCGLFPRLGVRHLMLWTDHPNWVEKGAALKPPLRDLLGHPMHRHFVKSDAAAREVREVLGWSDVRALHMAEDPGLLRVQRDDPPSCDAVLIVSDPAPVPGTLSRFLDDEDPDPASMRAAMRPDARPRFVQACAGLMPGDDAGLLFDAWEAAHGQGAMSFHAASSCLSGAARASFEVLRGDAERYYAALAAMHTLTAWRRWFWPAWLTKRARVESHGAAGVEGAGGRGAEGQAGGGWVEYTDQPRVYARGSACVTINAGHDEEGMSHKVFQIAACGGACVHHATRGLGDCFELGSEVLAFSRGPELLDAVRRLACDRSIRARIGDAARARLERDHTWDRRLAEMLGDG